MKVLVVCPMKGEYNNFVDALKNTPHQNDYKVICCGVGKVNAAASVALELYTDYKNNIDLVAVVGYAAASPNFTIGDIVIPDGCRYHDVNLPDPSFVPELTKVYPLQGEDEVTILTGDSFVDEVMLNKLISTYGCNILCDMECTAVSQVCYDLEIPVIALKLVSDIPGEEGSDFNSFVETHTDFTPFVNYIEFL